MTAACITPGWVAREAIRWLHNRGHDGVGVVRVWFVGDSWSEIRTPVFGGQRLEMLFPFHPRDFETTSVEDIRAALYPRVQDAVERKWPRTLQRGCEQ